MKTTIGLILCSVLLSFNAFAKQRCDNQCQTQLINSYYADLDKILTKGSTVKDIESFLTSLDPQTQYLHPEYEADFNIERWRKAFTHYLDKGRYNSPKEAATSVNNIIHGYQYAAVEKIDRYLDDESGQIKQTPPRLALFGFKDGKINYIRDYWHHSVEP